MFHKLHLQLTSFCILVISGILLFMTGILLHLVSQNEQLNNFQNFEEAMNDLYQGISESSSLSHSWLEEISEKNNLEISILDNQKPLLYHKEPENPKTEDLILRAKEIALNQYTLSELSVKKSSTLIHKEFPVNTGRKNICFASVAYIPMAYSILDVTVISRQISRSFWSNSLYLRIIITVLCAVCLLSLSSFFLIRYMLRPLEKAHTLQRNFFADASHELRSPLAVLLSSLSAIEACPERTTEFQQIIKKECLRMQRLVNDMFTLASLDNGNIAIHPQKCFLDTLFLETYEKFEGSAIQKGIFLEISIPDHPFSPAFCDSERIAQVLTILFDNAVSYTPEGGHILASISEGHNCFVITVSDNGPGISDEAKKEIFQRFYRCDQSRTNKNHFGLGLSIAKTILDLHGGTISITDSPEGGASFTVTLPASKNTSDC